MGLHGSEISRICSRSRISRICPKKREISRACPEFALNEPAAARRALIVSPESSDVSKTSHFVRIHPVGGQQGRTGWASFVYAIVPSGVAAGADPPPLEAKAPPTRLAEAPPLKAKVPELSPSVRTVRPIRTAEATAELTENPDRRQQAAGSSSSSSSGSAATSCN